MHCISINQVKSLLNQCESSAKKKNIEKELNEVSKRAFDYLNSWIEPLRIYETFNWMSLENELKWESVQETIEMLLNRKLLHEIDEGKLIDQFKDLKEFQAVNIKDETFTSKTISERWTQLFNISKDFCNEYMKIAYIYFSIPAHNVNSERIFSYMNLTWTQPRGRMSTETVKSILMVQYNLCKAYTCKEFYDIALKNQKLLSDCRSVRKYYKNSDLE